jgi:transposase
MTEVLFVDWVKTVFIPWNANLRQKFQYEGPIVLLLDGHATHVTDRVRAYAGSERIMIIRLVVHSSHLSQLLD